MTTPHAGSLTVDDLFDIPDDGNRYEIFNGKLLVTPPPPLPHAAATTNLRDRLYDQAPRHLRIAEGVGIYANDSNYFIPDLVVIPHEVLSGDGIGIGIRPNEPLLVAEVVSPSNPSNDLITKREFYARFRIAEYWIVDRRDRSLTILQLGADDKYTERAVLHPGEIWRSQFPFPLQIGPAELF